MPPRIGHRKSKGGCRLCKSRKVKCDESRPRCGWCLHRGVPCFYDSDSLAQTVPANYEVPSSSHFGDDSSFSNTPSSNSAGSGATDYAYDERLSLFLLHHFTSVVTPSFPTEQISAMRRLYAGDMVQIAFTHDFLLNAILSVSAQHLHLASRGILKVQSPSSTETTIIPPPFIHVDFALVHSQHLGRAIIGQRDALVSLQPENALAVFYASVLLCIATIQSIRQTVQLQTDYKPPIEWLIVSKGVATVSYAALPNLPPQSAIEFLASLDGVDYLKHTELLYDPVNATELRGLLDFVDDTTAESKEDLVSCQAALALIGGIYNAIILREPAAQICRRLMAFGPLAPPLYVTSVKQRQPRALSILAQFMAMTKIAEREGYWWFHGVADREIHGLKSLLPSKWQWATDWPMMVVQRGWEPSMWSVEPPCQCPVS
ncbi:Fc.00g026410.m01.CDS01 [Cosmosporella sp. VM-42]